MSMVTPAAMTQSAAQLQTTMLQIDTLVDAEGMSHLRSYQLLAAI